MDELQILRRRHDELVNSLIAPPVYVGENPSCLALTTTKASYPTDAHVFFAVRRLDLLGDEVEGGPGNVLASPDLFYALNIGSTIPPSGTQVLVTFVGNRWVFRYDT